MPKFMLRRFSYLITNGSRCFLAIVIAAISLEKYPFEGPANVSNAPDTVSSAVGFERPHPLQSCPTVGTADSGSSKQPSES